MHRMDIREKEDEYIVTFEIPGIREENILIKGENDSLNVIAINKTVTTEMKNGNIDIDHKTIIYNKTAIVTNADFQKIKYTFFAGWLEVIVPKKK
ncbi:MAG: Hsp20/alpha crystallin family protein [Candidatus Woesearchaeota archaeon]